MTATTATTTETGLSARRGILAAAWSDVMAVAQRNLIALRRTPQLVVFSTIQPIMFVLMFRYVFGGAIRVPGLAYVDYLMPGIFVQTAVFGAMGTAIGLATDLKSGLLERFLSLPMARSAVLVGRTVSDLFRNVFVMVLMAGVGFLVGFRVPNGLVALAIGMLLVLLFSYALTWIFATVGLIAGDAETAQAAAFPVLAPLVFASSVFVPVSSMPSWLQGFANHQPVSVTASAVRALVLGNDSAQQLLGGSTATFVLQSLAWSIGILVVCAPLAVARYRRAL
jgi:ABC-2 type transport system permease protein/oleandomycin transport system permease protein